MLLIRYCVTYKWHSGVRHNDCGNIVHRSYTLFYLLIICSSYEPRRMGQGCGYRV